MKLGKQSDLGCLQMFTVITAAVLFLSLVSLLPSYGQSFDYRDWHSINGDTVRGALSRVSGNSIILRTPHGGQMQIEIDLLSAKDVAYVFPQGRVWTSINQDRAVGKYVSESGGNIVLQAMNGSRFTIAVARLSSDDLRFLQSQGVAQASRALEARQPAQVPDTTALASSGRSEPVQSAPLANTPSLLGFASVKSEQPLRSVPPEAYHPRRAGIHGYIDDLKERMESGEMPWELIIGIITIGLLVLLAIVKISTETRNRVVPAVTKTIDKWDADQLRVMGARRMNGLQRAIVFVSFLVIVGMSSFPPWSQISRNGVKSPHGYHLILNPPHSYSSGYEIDFTRLLVQIIIVAGVGAAGFVFFAGERR